MSDTDQTEAAEGWMDGQEPSDSTGDYNYGNATDQNQGYATDQEQGYAADQEQGYAADQAQGYAADQEQGYAADQAQGYAADQAQGYAADQAQGYATDQAQGYATDQAQGYATDQAQGWTTDQEWGTDQQQGWPTDAEGGTGDAGQTLAMYTAGDAATPAGQGSPGQVNVEFESGPSINGKGFEVVIRNIGSSTIPAMTVLGTYAVYKREGLQVYPRDLSVPSDTLEHPLDIPAGGSATVFVELEHIPGPAAALPDGEYRVRVYVGSVGRELPFRKRMGKVEP